MIDWSMPDRTSGRDGALPLYSGILSRLAPVEG
jgi:hypothetical protein